MAKNKYFDFHTPVFIPSALIIILFVTITLYVGDPVEQLFQEWQTALYDNVGWFFVIVMNTMVIMALVIAFGKLGKIRLGGPTATPEFSNFSWYSMLFSAGMGIGLVYFGVAEPIQHTIAPPKPVGSEVKAAEQAFQFTFLHYGVHPWGVYGMVALSLAFFTFNRKLPLSVRSLFAPLLKRTIYVPIGDVVDILAVIACIFGLATTLGFGAQQLSSGISFLFGTEDTVRAQVIIITLVTLAATTSVILGLDKGVRVLSEANIRISVIFLFGMLILGPTVYILDSFIENVGLYFQNLLEISSYTEVYSETAWQNNWTIFYWAWWIAWSPFVGIFIARVSKGRTIREFLVSVVLLPTAFSFFWFTVFGSSAIYLELNGLAPIGEAVDKNISTALFSLLGEYPLSKVMSFIGVLLIIGFFVTSSDSGSLVIDSITSGGKLDAPVGQRIFWALAEGALAATLLIGGGLVTLQTAVMLASLPFAMLLLVMGYSLVVGLRREQRKNMRMRIRRLQRREMASWEYNYREMVEENEDDDDQ
jgi:choline/glycine/proline betaine transport protein